MRLTQTVRPLREVNMPVYQFQCMRCFITSGIMSRNIEDAPSCCGGELMSASEIGAHLTRREPDFLKAAVLSLPDTVLVENALPAVSG